MQDDIFYKCECLFCILEALALTVMTSGQMVMIFSSYCYLFITITCTCSRACICIMDTLGPTIVLIFQVSLYDKAPFGIMTKCVEYAGVHIFTCPD